MGEKKDREDFLSLRKRLVEQLEDTWEESDEGVLEQIDTLMGDYCRSSYLPISRREELRRELFQSKKNGCAGRTFGRRKYYGNYGKPVG